EVAFRRRGGHAGLAAESGLGQGSFSMRGRVFHVAMAALTLGTLSGCSDTAAENTPPKTASPASTLFDAPTAGDISGQVIWEGDLPAPDWLEMRTDPPVARGQRTPNPNQAQVDPASKGIGNAVVFLRGAAARKSRPWDHPPVRVQMRDFKFRVHQGEAIGQVGFVRAGDGVDFVSRDAFHALEVRGAAFFSLRFVDANAITQRPLPERGLVDLSSAAGYYWMRAYLFVDEHPYYAHTDNEGRFHLKQVPPGEYQLVCWLANDHIRRRERDPENGLVTRLVYGPPLQIERAVTIRPKQNTDVCFTIQP